MIEKASNDKFQLETRELTNNIKINNKNINSNKRKQYVKKKFNMKKEIE